MRVFLTKSDLQNPAAVELLNLCVRIAEDGQITLDEIKELRRCLERMNHRRSSQYDTWRTLCVALRLTK